MKNGTKLTNGGQLEATSVNVKRYILAELLKLTNTMIDELNGINDVEFIEGTQTASTNAWTGVTKDSALYKGKFIIYKLPYAGTSNATLNLTLADGTKTGAKNIYRYASTRLKTEYGANYYIPLIYNGTYWFALADFGSTTNYYDRTRIANAVVTASGEVKAVCFVGTTDGTHYKELSAGTTFNVNYPVLYNATAVADGAAMSTGLYFAVPSINLHTVLSDEERTFAEKVPIYLKGTLNGSTFTVHSDILTTTAPTTDDGFLYLRVGFTYSTYQVYVMLFENNFFAYKNGVFQEVNLLALKSLSDIRGQQIDTTYIKDISGGNGVLTLTKGDNTFTTVSCIASGVTLNTVPSTVEGAMWIEGGGSVPIIKLYYGGNAFKITPELVAIKATPTLVVGDIVTNALSINMSSVTSVNIQVITYTGDGNLYLFDFTGNVQATISGTKLEIGSGNGTFKVGATEGTNYAAATPVTVTVTGNVNTPTVFTDNGNVALDVLAEANETTTAIAQMCDEGINNADNVLAYWAESTQAALEGLVDISRDQYEMYNVQLAGTVPDEPVSITAYLDIAIDDGFYYYVIFTTDETVSDYTLIEAVRQSDASITFELPVEFIAEYLDTPMTMIVLQALE